MHTHNSNIFFSKLPFVFSIIKEMPAIGYGFFDHFVFQNFFGQKCKCCLNGIESFSSEDLLSELASGLPFRWFFIIGRPVVIKPFGIIWKNNADKRFYCRCCICFISFIILSPCFCWINFNKVLNFFGGWIDAFLTRRSIWNAFKWLFFNSLPYNHANYNMIFWKKYVIFLLKCLICFDFAELNMFIVLSHSLDMHV